jgi:hypothetical protein
VSVKSNNSYNRNSGTNDKLSLALEKRLITSITSNIFNDPKYSITFENREGFKTASKPTTEPFDRRDVLKQWITSLLTVWLHHSF